MIARVGGGETFSTILNPRSDYLLEDPKSFSSKQTVSSLFGKRLLEAMLKRADQDEKLGLRGPPGPARSKAASSGPVTRSRGGRGLEEPEGTLLSFENDKSGGRGRRYVPSQNGLFVSTPHPLPITSCGVRLRFFQTNWGRLSSDTYWIMATISHGFRIDFISVPVQTDPPMVRMKKRNSFGLRRRSDEFFSALLVVPKKARAPSRLHSHQRYR